MSLEKAILVAVSVLLAVGLMAVIADAVAEREQTIEEENYPVEEP
jgi:hypothetical protein